MKRISVPIIFGSMMILLATSCSIQTRPGPSEANSARTVIELPESHDISKAATRVYPLGYGDVLEVKFFHNSEYNETATVRPDGRISLQRIGDIDVVGMTPEELDHIITDVYSEILVMPDVTVIVREFGGQNIYVMGEVGKPGSFPLEKGMTLLRAIAAAGGPNKTGKMNSVILVRADMNRRVQVSRLDVGLSSVADNVRNDVPLQSYDMIYVPKTFIADVGEFFEQIYDVILPPFDVWSRYAFWYKR